MKRFSARYLLGMTTEDLWDTLTGEFILVFDNGEFKTNFAETCYSSYVWDFHRRYPKTPLLMRHHIRGISLDRRLSISLDLELLGTVMMAVYDTYRHEGVEVDPTLSQYVAMINNNMYVNAIKHADAYTGTIDILHIYEALDEPSIFEANLAVKRGDIHIHEVYKVLSQVFNDPTKLIGNPIARDYRSKQLKQAQVEQVIGPRGHPTDMDSRIFAVPVLRGYGEGLRSLHDSMVESRSAARSSYYAAEALRMSEYFSRKLQFISQNVQHLHKGDCGSQIYLEWKIRKAPMDEKGNQIRSPDLELLHGKLYLDEETGRLKSITPHDRHLIGKVVKLRSTLHCCHPDPVGVCATCYGDLALGIPKGTNIGQAASTDMAAQASQALLSAKHLETSSALDMIMIDQQYNKFIVGGHDNSSYRLAKAIEDKEVHLILNKDQVESLNDVMTVQDIEEHPPQHYTEMKTITLEVDDGKFIDEQGIPVEITGRLASLTHPMLHYIREHGWKMVPGSKISPGDKYRINLTDWNWDEPFLTLPAKHFNNSDHVDQVARMLESRVTEMRKRSRVESVDTLMLELFDYVNWKLNVNLAALEIILYATTIVSAEDNDYSLPKPWTKSSPSVLTLTMANRSASVQMAYEKQYERIVDPQSYLNTNRLDHIFDGIITPAEVFGNHD